MRLIKLGRRLVPLSIIVLFITTIITVPIFAAPSGEIYFPDGQVDAEDMVLEFGHSGENTIIFKNTASGINDVASTIQYITLAAANLNPSRALIALDASWEIYESETNLIPRVTGTVTGSLDQNAIYAPYSTSQTVYLHTWKLGKPAADLDAYTSSSQFHNELKILRPGEVLKLTITVECQNIEGDTRIWFFFRATEFHPDSPPITNLSAIPESERVNLYYSKSPGPDQTKYWWPLHNSYDPYDANIGTGHAFNQNSWAIMSTTRAFAKANKLVHQKPDENPRNPCIEIIKEGPTEALTGETILYQFTVSNCGNLDLSNVTVVDTLMGSYNIGDLPVGASINFTDTHTVSIVAPDSLVNMATATGEYDSGSVSHRDSHTVIIVEVPDPCIDIIKQGPPEALRGENVTYEFTVSNCGNMDLSNVTVTDTILGNYNIGNLPVGASITFTDTYIIPAEALESVVNNATASGEYDESEEVTDSDGHSINITEIINPCIDIIKEGPLEALAGETIIYEFTVSNCGNVDLSNVTVNDTLLGSYDIGDLSVGASTTFTDTYNVPDDPPDPLTNTATASGWYEEEHVIKEVTHSTIHSVNPGLSFSFHICGMKFNDSNRNALLELEAEPGYDGVWVTLLGADSETPAEVYYAGKFNYAGCSTNPAETGEDGLYGSYCFDLKNVTPGTYTFYLEERVPFWMEPTTPPLIGPITLVASSIGPRISCHNDFGNATTSGVGGEVRSTDKLAIMAPWLALAIVLISGIAVFVKKHRVSN